MCRTSVFSPERPSFGSQANMAASLKSDVIMCKSCSNPLTLHHILIILIPRIDIAVLQDPFHCHMLTVNVLVEG